MTHQIRWSAQGWHVVTLLGSMVLATTLLCSYAEALDTLAALGGVA
jgi:hypothetical protein